MPAMYDLILTKGTPRYRCNKNFVSKKDVPEQTLEVLTPKNIVDENGIIIVDEKETNDIPPADGDAQSDQLEEGKDQQKTEDPDKETARKDKEPEEKKENEVAKKAENTENTEVEAVQAKPAQGLFKSKVPQSDAGFGFPRVAGKTVDIFDGVTPHTQVKLVGGITVPLSTKNYKTKTDIEILNRIKQLGYKPIDFTGRKNADDQDLEDVTSTSDKSDNDLIDDVA